MVRGRKPILHERITTSISVERLELEILQSRGIELSELVRDAIKEKIAVSSLEKLKLKAERLRDSIRDQSRELEYLDIEIKTLEDADMDIDEVETESGSPAIHPLNNPFRGSVFHHMHLEKDHSMGLYIPKQLHRTVGHSSISGRGMKDINKASLLWLCEQAEI